MDSTCLFESASVDGFSGVGSALGIQRVESCPVISVVVPVYRGEDFLAELYRRWVLALERWCLTSKSCSSKTVVPTARGNAFAIWLLPIVAQRGCNFRGISGSFMASRRVFMSRVEPGSL